MNVQSVVVLIVIAVAAVVAVIHSVKNKNSSCCGGDCSMCSAGCKKQNK